MGEYVVVVGCIGFNVFRLVVDFGELFGDLVCVFGFIFGGFGFVIVGGIELD